jgi:uncharacterized protein involved in exopolysaccharide biosynthesis
MTYESMEERVAHVNREPAGEFDPFEFVAFARTRWRTALISSVIAIALAAAVTWILPDRYTATASILIEPPAGNDPRGATAVSPVYLESLKTYEHFASSDTLFAQALDHLRLRDAYRREPMESLKRRVLRVTKLRDTKILEISATLKDPAKAQALAEYIAKEAVNLNKSLDDRSQRDLSEQARQFLTVATERVRKAEQARNQFLAGNSVVALEDAMAGNLKLKAQIQGDLSYARAELAEYEAQYAHPSDAPVAASAASLSQGIISERANINALEQQEKQLEQQIAKNSLVLEQRKHERDVLDTELLAARTQYESANTKNNDILSSSAFRGERLDIIDPGVVPQRPSFPNLPLNIVIAFFGAAVGWLLYVAIGFSFSRIGLASAYLQKSALRVPRTPLADTRGSEGVSEPRPSGSVVREFSQVGARPPSEYTTD